MMKKTYHYLLLFAVMITGCHRSHNPKSAKSEQLHHATKAEIRALHTAKNLIDTAAADTDKLVVLVKVPGKKELVTVKGNTFPDDIETTFNLLKDKDGHVIYTVEIPESESGDWFISYFSYYRPDGQLFAFSREAGFFNGECKVAVEEPVHERLVKYFDKDFNLVDTVYGLKDSKGKKLKKSKCDFPYDYPYKIEKTVDEFMKDNNIP
jgi:hypothetical protein